jgi:hypothetical protein
MKLSKLQIEVLEKSLSHPFGNGVQLMCDGYKIKGLTYRVMIYVNGEFKGLWCNPKNECPEQKFMRKSVKPLCSPARKREAEKALGKMFVKNRPYYSLTITNYWPDWANGKAALNHLNKVCESIQLAE